MGTGQRPGAPAEEIIADLGQKLSKAHTDESIARLAWENEVQAHAGTQEEVQRLTTRCAELEAEIWKAEHEPAADTNTLSDEG